MADPPRRRPPPGPPPRPPSDLPEEPFRRADTPRTGTIVGLRPVSSPLPPRDDDVPDAPSQADIARLLRGMRRDLVVLRESLPPATSSASPSIRTRSRKALVGAVGVAAATGITAVLTLLGGIAAKQWPAYAELIKGVVQALGGGP